MNPVGNLIIEYNIIANECSMHQEFNKMDAGLVKFQIAGLL